MTGQQLKRVLGTPSLIAFGMAYMVPMTVFTTYGIVSQVTDNHLPLAYAITLIVMLFTAYSYTTMVKVNPSSGSTYSYVKNSFGTFTGFMAGWALLLDYLFIPMINYKLIGMYFNAEFPSIPTALLIVTPILLGTLLNILGIIIVSSIEYVLIALQFIFIAVFATLAIYYFMHSPSETTTSNLPLETNINYLSIFAGSAILCLSFLGFDAISTLTEEAKKPSKTVPRAIMACTLICGSLFILIAWLGQLVIPDWRFFSNIETAARELMVKLGGQTFTLIFTIIYIFGAFASAVASQASVSRILYTMGRDNSLPKTIFGTVHQRYQTPVSAIIIVGLLSLLALVLPLEFVASMISFGALVAFSFVNLTVIKHHFYDNPNNANASIIKHGLIPLIGFISCIWLWSNLSFVSIQIGICWAIIGYIIFIITKKIKRNKPDIDVIPLN